MAIKAEGYEELTPKRVAQELVLEALATVFPDWVNRSHLGAQIDAGEPTDREWDQLNDQVEKILSRLGRPLGQDDMRPLVKRI